MVNAIVNVTDPAGSHAIRRDRFATSNADLAADVLRHRYSDYRQLFCGEEERFTFDLEATSITALTGTMRIDRVRHNMWISADVEPQASANVVVPARGFLKYTTGRDEILDGPILAPTWSRFRCEWDDIDVAIGSLDPEILQRIAAEMFGLEESSVALTGVKPVSLGRASYVTSVLNHLERNVVTNAQAMSSALARSDAIRQFATALLVTFPNTGAAAAGEPARHGFAEPSVLRRALDYIDEHVDTDIGVNDVAHAARISVRGLRMLFRRHRNCTPTAYLRSIRLERANADLQAADVSRGDTVAAISARWGFSHPGRFSADYRKKFGRAPKDTLRKRI